MSFLLVQTARHSALLQHLCALELKLMPVNVDVGNIKCLFIIVIHLHSVYGNTSQEIYSRHLP